MLNNTQLSRPLSHYAKPANTALTTIYTVPDRHTAQLTCLHIANTHTGNTSFSMEIASVRLGVTMYIYDEVVIPSKSILTVDTLHLYLGPGDVIKVTSSVANNLAVTISLDEQYDPNKTHGA